MDAGTRDDSKRRYVSPSREAGARRTRQAIVAAARELFAERGYAGASLATIAQAAGVARPTVAAAFGSKVELLRVVLGEALAGDDEPVPVAQRDWFQPVWDADTGPEVIAAYADVCVLIGSRAARMFEVVRRAVDGNPAVAELWETMKGNRRAGASMIVDRVVSLGHLRADLDQGMAVDRLWILNDPALYEALVLQRDWEHETFRRWLAELMTSQLVAGPGSAQA
ncbi:MAG: hypothetical protein QG597_4878 [Actinomycetota bacterium]|nr:hypothetical protein [Actinomycetota bacterium]